MLWSSLHGRLCSKPEWFYLLPADLAVQHRGTPLYGQPSWWGDGDADDENSVKQDNKPSDPKQARCEPGMSEELVCRDNEPIAYISTTDYGETIYSSEIS